MHHEIVEVKATLCKATEWALLLLQEQRITRADNALLKIEVSDEWVPLWLCYEYSIL